MGRGDAAASGMRICAEPAKRKFRKRLSIRGRACRTMTVPAGRTKVMKIKVALERAARGRITPVRIRVRGNDVRARTLTVKVRVKR